MTSKEALEKISNIELYHREFDEDEDFDGDWKYLEYTEYDGLVREVYKQEIDTIKKDLARLGHYDLIKSDMPIFDRYRDDLDYICNLLNTYCKDREDWNKIAFKFQSIIGAINCCQFQQGAYDRLEERLEALEKENKKWREIVGCDLCEALGREILLEENEKLKKVIKIYTKLSTIDKECTTSYLVRNGMITQQEYELLKEVLGDERN